MNPNKTVFVIWLWSAIVAGIFGYLLISNGFGPVLLGLVILVAIFYLIFLHGSKK